MKQSTSFAQVATNLLNVLQGYTKSIRFVAVLTMLLTLGIGQAWAETKTYSYTFSAKQFSANGSKTLSNVSWTLAGDGGYWGYDATKGQQFGSGGAPYKTLTLSTSGISGTITKIIINTSGASSVNASFTVSVGGTQWGNSTKLTTSATNYTFTGSNSGEIKFSYTQTSSKALYIKSISVTYETAASYTVTYNANGGSGTMTQSTGSSITLKECTFTAPSGKEFDEWNTAANGSGTSYQVGDIVNESLNLYAIWKELPKYTVTFHTTATSETELTEDAAGAGVNPPTMEEECGDWTFQGWSKLPSNSETSTTKLDLVITLDDGIYYPTADAELYPVYTKSEGGGGTEYVLTDIGEISSGDIFVFADASNYALTNNNGTSSAVGVKQITVSNSKITSTVDATIEWQLTGNNTNGYTFYPGTGTTTWLFCNTTASSSSNNNMRVGTGDRKLFVVNNNGYLVTNDTYTNRYLSRYNTQDFRGYINTNTNPVNPKLYKKTAGSTTYYYSYPQCTTETVVTLDPNGGTFASVPEGWTKDGNNYKKEGVTGAITLPTPTKTGYNFDGWYDGETKVNSPYTPSKTVTLVAKWTAKQTQLSINANTANHGSGSGFSVVATYGEALPNFNPCTPATGYTLNGYYTEATGGTKIIDKDGKLVSNISDYTSADGKWASEAEQLILYAQYIINTYTVKFDNQGHGTKPDNQTINHGEKVNNPGNLTENGFIFGGWYKESGCTSAWNFETDVVASDITLYAKWTAKTDPAIAWNPETCTVTIDAGEELPVFQNPNELTGIMFTSSHPSVASVDENGLITLGTTATTATVTITATFEGNDTYAAKEVTCTLIVNPSNCRWVETDIANINSGDEVVITMCKGAFTWTISNAKNTSTAPPANDITANIQGKYLTTVDKEYKWVIEKSNDELTFYSYADRANYLYCINQDNGVRVGTGTAKVFVVDGNYLKNVETTSPRYLGVSLNTNPYTWRCCTITTGVISDQTLKFYKRECLDATNYWVTWDAGEGAWEDKSSKKIESYTVGATITKPADPSREGYRFDGWTPAPTIMPAQNTTFTAKWTEVYTITWYENGVPSYTYVPSDNPIVTWEDNIADCGEKKFYGWTADDTFVSNPTTPPTLISKGTTIAGDVTYYAVYADAEVPANPGYTKVTTISEGTYLIATDNTVNKAYTGRSGTSTYGGYCAVEIVDNVIKEPESAVEVEVTLNGSNFYMHDGTYYLGYTSGNAMTFDASIQTGNQNIWKLTTEGHIESVNVSGRILQYNSGSPRFACYTSDQKKAYLYKKQTTTYANFAVSCATYDISVTTPTGGTVTTNPAVEAGAGQTITVNVTPADCKYLTVLKYNYNDGSDHNININIASTPYTFTMPAADVTVTATFADKNATDIEILTSAHRMLMQGSAFVGEQVRITYNNGDKETLNWNDSRLTFTGHNTATLGSQTVTVTYNDCGTQSASYNIEVIDGLGITFWDGDYTETIKYEPGDLVDVDNKIGQNICSGWEFAGWSETKVANESEEYVPVHNFNATDAKVLYAVYVKKKAQWTTIVTADEAKSGAKYVLAYDRYDTYYALTSSVKDVNYLAGKVVTSTEGELNSFDVYYLSAEPTADLIWELVSTGENGKWYLYNKNTAKYIDLSTQGQIHLTDLPSDKLQMESGYNDSQIRIASSTVPTYYLSWDNSNTRYNTYASSNSQEYWYTKDEEFTSTPPCSPLSATFHGNGGIVTDGVNSGDDLTITEPTRDAGITTPTASFADCNGKSWTFVGWAREEIDVTCVPVLTTDLLHDGGGNKHYDIEEDGEEFWAVFTNIGNPETKYGTITFTDADVTREYADAKKITKSVTAMGDYDFELYHVSNASNKGIQFDNNVATKGYIKNITSLGKINSISLNDFQEGDIDDVKVYVGNMPNAINTLLTEADLQQIGNTYTYYPQKNYAYVKIEANGYCGITSISIDFGKGTQIWATTPDCSTITLSGDEIYITATNGRAIMASAPIAVKANQLEANANVILTSTSSDVYFSTERTFNFAAGQAASQKPKTSLTLPTDAEGNLATTDVYIHYMPSSEGDGVPANVIISANLETPNPSITDDHTIHVRNLPAKFVIATKVGTTWYALPANMTGETNPLAEVIEVDETTMTATAPNTSTYTLWPVKTTNGTGNRYADYGDRLRFAAVNNEQRGLWANNNNNSSAIRNYAVINSLGADGLAAYEWKVTTTVVDGHWQYTLQTDQTQNQNYLRYWTSAEGTPVGPKWGTYNAGENKLYFLPVTETQPFEYAVVEWYPTKVLIQTDAAITSPTVKVDGEAVASPMLTPKGDKLYEISNLPLETNPNKLLQISFTDNAINYTNTKVVPIILSRGAKTITGEPFATLTQKVYQYADVVVRDGATLSIDGTTDVANTLLGVTIYPTAKVSVEEGKKLSVHSLTFFGGIDEIYNGSTYTLNKYGVPELSLKGILYKSIAKMDYVMRVDLDQMYSLTVPYDVQLADIKYWDGSNIALGDALYVSAYDGAARANQSKKTWIYETDFASRLGAATLKAGVGYTISAELQAGVGNEYSILRMPMMSNVASGATEAAKTVAVTAWGKDANVTANHKGWNLVGNPYMTTIQGADDADLVLGYLKGTGTGPWEWVDDGIRYVTIPSDDGTYYWHKKFTTAELPPFKNFFVQIGTTGELAFGLGTRQSMPARSTQAAIEKEVEFEILMSNDARQDNTGLLISEEYSPAYEINADLEKMIGSMSVYTIYGGYKLAYNAISPINASEWIPMGYVAPAAGEYTFRLDDVDKIVEQVEHVYLIDYEANNIVDLMDDEYEFTTDKEQNNNRFAINVVLSQDKDNTTTGMDIINGNVAAPIKFIYHDKLYIQSGGVIYDGTGKQVTNINK